MKAILNLRTKMAQYQEIYYLIFIIITGGIASAGGTAGGSIRQYVVYKMLLAVMVIFWLLKMIVTDYTVSEILIMAATTVLLALNYMNNGASLLIKGAMVIFAAKNVEIKKVFKVSLYTKLLATICVFAGVFLGLIENVSILLPKHGVMKEIYCYGYTHPNITFYNWFSIAVIAILVFQEKMKWYVYVIVSLLLAVIYKYTVCRTGIMVWAVLCLMLIAHRLTVDKKIGKLYRLILTTVPVLVCIFTFILIIVCRYNEILNAKFNLYFTNRIYLMDREIDNMGFNILGEAVQKPFDNMYFYILYNYGWLVLLLIVLAYTLTMLYCLRKKLYYELIVLAAMSIYGFMEVQPLSAPRNITMIYFSYIMYKGNTGGNNENTIEYQE
jgi:hypothetical protein